MARTNPEDFLLFVDWDKSLFDNEAFKQDLWQEFANHSGESIEQVRTDAKQHRPSKKLGGYWFDRHVDSYNLDQAIMTKAVQEMLASNDYLYEDAVPFMQEAIARGYKPQILSYGEDVFQRLKIEPYIARLAGVTQAEQDAGNGIKFTTLMENKTDYITRHYPGKPGALIDDVAEQHLQASVSEITIDRTSGVRVPQPKTAGFVIANLMPQALEVIRTL